MSLLRPMGAQWRPPALGRELVVSSYRGITRVQKWPRPRGLPKDRRQRANLDYFRLIQKAVKLLSEDEVGDMRKALAVHNRKNVGQRGSAAIRMRDWQHQRLTGRGFAIDTDIGITFYPPAVRRDASHMLDHTIRIDGTFLTRAPEAWDAIPTGNPGDALFSDTSGQGAKWSPIQ